jgi:hypothetical protein
MGIFQLLEPLMIAGPAMLWLLALGPLVIYPFARWRMSREGMFDPQLGLKVVLHYFRVIAFQLLLVGGLVLLWTIIRAGSDKGDWYRSAIGLLIPSGLVFAVHTILLDRTNDKQLVTVRRMVLGLNLIVTGILGFASLVAAFEAMIAKGTSENGRLFIAGVFVYCGAWAACGFQFVNLTGIDLTGSSAPPQNMMPPSAPPPPGASGGLPPLGGGSYPPISR